MTMRPMDPAELAKLARMANQIADFFRAYPAEEARAGIRDHIGAFWSPPMRAAIRRAGPHAGLDRLVQEALHGAPAAESPILKETSGPDELGQLSSDAG